MERSCSSCSAPFVIEDADLLFYEKVSPTIGGHKFAVPAPTLCPACRRQRRLLTRNERRLYDDSCDRCHKGIISVYSPDKPFPVWCRECWWSDAYQPVSFGVPYDLSRPFTGQFIALQNTVPRCALNAISNENSEYVNQCGFSKNCYLAFNTDYSQDCYYTTNVIRSSQCMDLYIAESCELCFQCSNVTNCYLCVECRDCINCNNLFFSVDCIGCNDCFGCRNLRNRQYCFFNQQLTKEQYQEKMSQIFLGSRQMYGRSFSHALQNWIAQPARATQVTQCESVSGDHLRNCKDTYASFDCQDTENVKFCTVVSTLKDSYDFDSGGYGSELCYEQCGGGDQIYHCLFDTNLWGRCNDVYYSTISRGSRNCFGCVGLMGPYEYCILNKQYTKEQYELLVPQIIHGMEKTGEWGEFFHPSASPFGYNESVAMETFPLSREQALAKGFTWCDFEPPRPQTDKILTPSQVPDSSAQTPESILAWALECEVTRKPYRIIKQEFNFYREHSLPIPVRHPDQRHLDRITKRNPQHLFRRSCTNCSRSIDTTYAPDRGERVYCEECYLSAVY